MKEVSVMRMEPHHELSDKNTLCLSERAENKKWNRVSMENEIERLESLDERKWFGRGRGSLVHG